jgi:hypothetical protein
VDYHEPDMLMQKLSKMTPAEVCTRHIPSNVSVYFVLNDVLVPDSRRLKQSV